MRLMQLGKVFIVSLPVTLSFSCLAVVTLFLVACSVRDLNVPDAKPTAEVVSGKAHEPAAAAYLQPGEYITEKGWGRLQVIRQKGDLLFSLDSVTGEDSCTLSGEIKGVRGITKEDLIPYKCVLSFSDGKHGIEISASTQEECKHFCGYNAGFEGTYMRAKSGCRQDEIEQIRKGFEQLYIKKNYKTALEKLSPILDNCLATMEWGEEGSIRNDIAITQYRRRLYDECLETLSPYAEDAKRDDDAIAEDWKPALADRYLSIVRAARANIALCSNKLTMK